MELMWIKVDSTSQSSIVGALYNPPTHCYSDTELLDHMELTIEAHLATHPTADVIIGGDFKSLKVTKVTERTGLIPLVNVPTRGKKILDMLMAPADTVYQVKVLSSAV